jgi:hypothetical protein
MNKNVIKIIRNKKRHHNNKYRSLDNWLKFANECIKNKIYIGLKGRSIEMSNAPYSSRYLQL